MTVEVSGSAVMSLETVTLAVVHRSHQSGFVVILGEAVGELGGTGDLHVVLFGNRGDEAQVLNLAALEGAVHDLAQHGVDGGSETLHGGGDGHALAVQTVDGAGLVNVNADDLAAGLGCGFTSGGEDAAAAGEDHFGASAIPGVHGGGDVGVAVELVAVGILHG